jgi:hypothetical protein
MVGGAAYYAGRKIAQGDQRESEQEQRLQMLEAQQMSQAQYSAPQQYSPPPPAPPQYSAPAPAPQRSVVEELTDLKNLLDAGALTQAEFDAQKAKLLQR